MARYEFTPNLETGNKMIDDEHRELIAAVNRLLDASSAGNGREQMKKTIDFLNNYVDKHFLHEEQLQQRSGYPNYAGHKQFHDGYKKKLRDVTAGITGDGATIGQLAELNGHISVLISHIRTEDKKLGAFLSGK